MTCVHHWRLEEVGKEETVGGTCCKCGAYRGDFTAYELDIDSDGFKKKGRRWNGSVTPKSKV